MRLKDYFILLTLLFLSAVYNSAILSAVLGRYDEGIVLVGAMRVLAGELPHRDFWSIYPPGQSLVLAELFKAFGVSLEVARFYDLCVRIITSSLVYVFLRNISVSRLLSLIGWVSLTFWLGAFDFSGYPVFPAIMMLLVAASFLAIFAKSKSLRAVFVGGLFIGLTTLFRFDFGVVGLISYLLALYVFQKASLCNASKTLFFATLGAGSFILATFGPLSYSVGFENLFTQLVLTPAAVMPKYRALAIPAGFTALSAPFYICPLILIFSLYIALNRLKIRSLLAGELEDVAGHMGRRRLGAILLFFSTLGLFSLNQALVRSDMIHLLPLIFVCSILSPIVFYLLITELRARVSPKLNRAAVFSFALIFLMTLSYPAALRIKKYLNSRSSYPVLSHGIVSEELASLVDFISAHTHPSDSIYVGVINHDKFTYNDVAVYFLARRMIPTRYHELHPGVTTTPQVQNEIVDELEISSPKLLILANRYIPTEDNQTSVDLGLDILDLYIQSKFKKINEFGPYQVFAPIAES
jgi:hypothetical protein